MDSNLHHQKESRLPEHLEDHEKERLVHQHRGNELMKSSHLGDALRKKIYFKALMIRFIFLLLAISAFSGQIQHATNGIMGPVWKHDQEYLEKTQ